MHLFNDPSCHRQALENVVAEEVPGWMGETLLLLLFPWGVCTWLWPCTPWPCSSVSQRSGQRRREFMKKLETVESSRPNCWEIVTCISLEGRRFSLKMATKVRRCRSVKTSRCFFGTWLRSRPRSSSLRLQAGDRMSTEAVGRREDRKTEETYCYQPKSVLLQRYKTQKKSLQHHNNILILHRQGQMSWTQNDQM